MADLPLEGRTVVTEKKENPLTLEQRVDLQGKDIQELARGLNTQARLLEAVVTAANYVGEMYAKLTQVSVAEAASEKKEE